MGHKAMFLIILWYHLPCLKFPNTHLIMNYFCAYALDLGETKEPSKAPAAWRAQFPNAASSCHGRAHLQAKLLSAGHFQKELLQSKMAVMVHLGSANVFRSFNKKFLFKKSFPKSGLCKRFGSIKTVTFRDDRQLF